MDAADTGFALARRAIALAATHWRRQPDMDELAADAGLRVADLRQAFMRWCGMEPAAFLQTLTPAYMRALLRDAASVVDPGYKASRPGGLPTPDLHVTHEFMPPEAVRRGGAGAKLAVGFHASPFGEAILVATPRGLVGLGFVDGGDRAAALADMQGRWPAATLAHDDAALAGLAERAFDTGLWRAANPLHVVLIGTAFEASVWQVLLRLPLDRATTYGAIARQIGRPAAARAVGAAVGKNPVSFVVPCHRVLGASGALTGYYWGLARKQAMLGWEAGAGLGKNDVPGSKMVC